MVDSWKTSLAADCAHQMVIRYFRRHCFFGAECNDMLEGKRVFCHSAGD
jgi:hypothetical protein